MFTGIIEEKGVVQKIEKGGRSASISIEAELITEDLHMGDSIAVNGICLTVTEFSTRYFKADVMPETIDRTSLKQLKAGSMVNLERAMPANGRFGGHIVTGHVDGCGVITHIKEDDNAVWYAISAGSNILCNIVEKGSITVDGISLTVAGVSKTDFKVSIIPHTRHKTTLGKRRTGDIVNLETDIVGKYIAKFLGHENTIEKKSKINMKFLAEHGII